MRLSNWSEKLEHNKWLLKYQKLDRWQSVGQTWVRRGFIFFSDFFLARMRMPMSKLYVAKKFFFEKKVTFFWKFFRSHVRFTHAPKKDWKIFFFPTLPALLSCLLVLADKIRPYSLPRSVKVYGHLFKQRVETKNTLN